MSPSPSPMWMAHHDPDAYDRCVVVGHHHVCRRCVVLYPAMIVVAAVQLSGWIPADVGLALMWIAPLGVVAEWIGEHVGNLAYSPRRQTVLTLLASVSFGVALGRHVRRPFEAAAAAPAITFTVICLVTWCVGARRHVEPVDWEQEFDLAERDRRAELESLLAQPALLDVPAQPASATKSMSSSTAPTSDGLRSL